jgi:hypothetical protein
MPVNQAETEVNRASKFSWWTACDAGPILTGELGSSSGNHALEYSGKIAKRNFRCFSGERTPYVDSRQGHDMCGCFNHCMEFPRAPESMRYGTGSTAANAPYKC